MSVAQDAGSIPYIDRKYGECVGLCGSFRCANQGTVRSYSCVAENDERDDDGKFACVEYAVDDRICGEPDSGGGGTYCNYYYYCSRVTQYGLRCSGPPDCQQV